MLLTTREYRMSYKCLVVVIQSSLSLYHNGNDFQDEMELSYELWILKPAAGGMQMIMC